MNLESNIVEDLICYSAVSMYYDTNSSDRIAGLLRAGIDLYCRVVCGWPVPEQAGNIIILNSSRKY